MALINCSECGKQISDKAEICPSCGNPCAKRCNECGTSIEKGEKMCPNCGKPCIETEKISQEKTVYIQPERKSGGGVWVFVGVLIAIVLIIIIIGSL